MPPLPPLPPLLGHLPGAGQRRRAIATGVGALVVILCRPLPPFRWLPGWSVGLLLLLATAELLRWLWWPRRWR